MTESLIQGEGELEEERSVYSPQVLSSECNGETEDIELVAVEDTVEGTTESLATSEEQALRRPRFQLLISGFFQTKERQWSVAVSSLVPALLALLIGFTMAFPSSAVLDLMGAAKELPPSYLLPPFLLSLFAALGAVGAVFGGPIGGWVADRWGRKCALLFCGVPYLIGYLTLSYAHYTSTATAFMVLILTGRFISGVGMGWASSVVPVYIAEVSSAKYRGIYGTLVQIMITSGIILNYGVSSADDFPYYYTSLVAVGVVALFEVLMFWLSETPRWLLSRGYEETAENVLKWLRGKETDIKQEMDKIKVALLSRRKNVCKVFWNKKVLVPFVYVLLAFIFQQAGGINAVTSYTTPLFFEAGVSNPHTTAVFAVGCSGLISTFITFSIVDFIGRKILLVLSGIGMFLGTALLGTHFLISRPSLCDFLSLNSTAVDFEVGSGFVIGEPCNAQFGPMAITGLTVYRIAFSIGWGPIPWLLLSELLPLSVRGISGGLIVASKWSAAAVITGVYLTYAELARPWFAMWTLGLFILAGTVFVVIFIPETKGKNLEDLERRDEYAEA